MPRKKLTEEEKAKKKAEAEAKKAAEAAEIERLRKKKQFVDEILAIVILAVGVFLALSMFTNTTGSFGAAIKSGLTFILGTVAYVIPVFFVIYGVLIFAGKTAFLTVRSLICTLVFFMLLSALFGVKGGNIGGFLNSVIVAGIGTTGLWILCIAGIVITLVFLVDTPISQIFDKLKLKRQALKALREEQKQMEMDMKQMEKEVSDELAKKEEEKQPQHPFTVSKASELPVLNLNAVKEEKQSSGIVIPEETAASIIQEQIFAEPEPIHYHTNNSDDTNDYSENQKNIISYMTDDNLFGQTSLKDGSKGLNGEDTPAPVAPVKVTAKEVADVQKEVSEDINKALKETKKYSFPPIDLLKKSPTLKGQKGESLESLSELLENTLESFGVSAKVVDVVKGPAVTRFEVQPAPGVKVSRIASLQNDLALNMRAKSLRIEAPIPGKAAVGIEVSNESISVVSLREIIESKDFKQHKSKIAVAVGKSISGESVVCNIKDMPHLLIAGSTGSGKSVCINSMLLSLLYKSTPDEVKLILIDPKIVELSVYNGIPHLLIPVVTDPAKASAALGWAVTEMNERYNKFAEEQVRDLSSYNDYVRANGEDEKVMPQIIIVIDELHDLMLSAKNTVEDNIARLTAKARAAGMHLVVATQRPSVDVITGVIKNNIPSRIAFAVGNSMDSRTILDEGGAEHLLGKGDMLYAPQGSSKPLRVQGCLVTDSEVTSVIEYVKNENADNLYNADVITAIDKAGTPQATSESGDEEDELLPDAIECVVRAGECSVSMVQRRFRIGYNHAARLVEIMEERGIVGPADGARKRKVLLSLDELMAIDAAASEIPEEID